MSAITVSDRLHTGPDEHLVHRLAHATYGLIVLTALVGELRVEDESASTAIGFVAAGAAVLVIAHGYSQLVATSALRRRVPSRREAGAGVVDQLALAIPAAIAVLVFGLAEADLYGDETAYAIVLSLALVGLFALGLAIGWRRAHRPVWSLTIGALNLGIGLAVIVIERLAGH